MSLNQPLYRDTLNSFQQSSLQEGDDQYPEFACIEIDELPQPAWYSRPSNRKIMAALSLVLLSFTVLLLLLLVFTGSLSGELLEDPPTILYNYTGGFPSFAVPPMNPFQKYLKTLD